MDLASFAGGDYLDVVLDGESFRVGELTLAEWAPIQAWIKATVPGPLSVLSGPDFEALPSPEREAVRRLAFQEARGWPPRVGSRGWFEALDHPGGNALLLHALLARHQPAITAARCAELAERITIGEAAPLVAAGLGIFDPKAAPRRNPDRKGRRKAGPGTPATTSGRSSTSSPRRSGGPRSRRSG